MTAGPLPELTVAASPMQASYLQRQLWDRPYAMAPAARALRLSGSVDTDHLLAAIAEVVAAIDVLGVQPRDTGGSLVMLRADRAPTIRLARLSGPDRDERCAALLRDDRDRIADPRAGEPVRFHVIDLGGETVLGLVAHPLVLDLHSVYLVLGAVLLAYFGRFRPGQQPPFATVADLRPVADAAIPSRISWWERRLARWHRARDPLPVAAPAGARGESLELAVDADRWARLTGIAGHGGNSAGLAVIALLAWWLRSGGPRPPVFGAVLDLRDYLGLGPVIGPLTDRVAFEVDLDGYDGMSFRDLLHRAHAGLLDAAVHYLPYGDVVALAQARGLVRPPRIAALWDVAVDYCRLPPASANTRGERTLAERGLSIELFREASLARVARAIDPSWWDGTALDVHLAERGTGMALVANVNPPTMSPSEVTGMLGTLDTMIDIVAADPDVAVRDLPDRTGGKPA